LTELRATAIALETLAGGVTDLTHGRRSRKEQEHISPAPPLPGDVLENEVVIVGPFSSFPLRFRHPFTALVTAEQRVSSALPDE